MPPSTDLSCHMTASPQGPTRWMYVCCGQERLSSQTRQHLITVHEYSAHDAYTAVMSLYNVTRRREADKRMRRKAPAPQGGKRLHRAVRPRYWRALDTQQEATSRLAKELVRTMLQQRGLKYYGEERLLSAGD